MPSPAPLAALIALIALAPLAARAVEFDRVVIDDGFPGAYQVEVADVNGDRRPDVIALGGGTCAWYENPTWKKRVVTGPDQTPGVISSAARDLDGDGKAEVAIAYQFAMNEPTKGKVLLARQGKTPDDPWTVEPIADMGSAHRLRWAKFPYDTRPKLVAAPIFGTSARPPLFNQEPARVVYFGAVKGADGERWGKVSVGLAPVLHAIDVLDLDGDHTPEVLAASNLGVTRFTFRLTGSVPSFESASLVPGAPGEAPKRGCSEVHVGRLKDGRRFLATVEPWHGSMVAVYFMEPGKTPTFGPRAVIDDTLDDGHALWVADVDGDGDDEILAGHRGKDHRVSAYDFDGHAWTRTVIDRAIAAQDLRGGDLDGNDTPDVVAVGGATHNVVWYRPRPRGAGDAK